MLKKLTFTAAILALLTAGCGRGDYDKKVEDAVRRAKNPPAADNKEGEPGKEGDAAKDGAAKDNAANPDAPMGDAPMADAPQAAGDMN